MLTPAQQTALDYHLCQVNRLTNEEFILELTDHYTSAVDERMAQGMTFETALTDIQQAFGGRKRLQKMERDYNRVTFRQYDALWMEYIREYSRWPRFLLPISVYIVMYWATTHTKRPVAFSIEALVNSPWIGYPVGAILGLTIVFFRLATKDSFRGRNLSYKAAYLATRFLPITVFLYGTCALPAYFNSYLPPFVYEAVISSCAATIVTYMFSYSRFYQSVFRNSTKVS